MVTWLTPAEAARELGNHPQAVWAAIQRHNRERPGLKAYWRNHKWYIKREDLDAYIARVTARAKTGPKRRPTDADSR